MIFKNKNVILMLWACVSSSLVYFILFYRSKALMHFVLIYKLLFCFSFYNTQGLKDNKNLKYTLYGNLVCNPMWRIIIFYTNILIWYITNRRLNTCEHLNLCVYLQAKFNDFTLKTINVLWWTTFYLRSWFVQCLTVEEEFWII